MASTLEVWQQALDDLMPGLVRVHLRGAKVWITFLNVGARIERWRRLDQHGNWVDLCLFYPDPRGALEDKVFMGVTVGRFANRIADGAFVLNGETVQLERNEGGLHHIHGGAEGFGQRMWTLGALNERGVSFSLHSPDGDQGYPGAVDMDVDYTLDSEDQLRISHRARCSRETIVNTTNHVYFNLNGVCFEGDQVQAQSVMNHRLQMAADQYLEDRGDFIPTGEVRSVENSAFDFRQERALTEPLGQPPALFFNTAYLNPHPDTDHVFAKVSAPGAAWCLSVATDAPGAVLYNGFALSKEATFGLYGRMTGLCIEPQNFPDCVNHLEWPTATMTPSQPYSRTIIYRLEGTAV